MAVVLARLPAVSPGQLASRRTTRCSLQNGEHRGAKRGPAPASASGSDRLTLLGGLLAPSAARPAQQTAQRDQQAAQLPGPQLSHAFHMAAWAGCTAVAADVFAPGSLHLLQPVDSFAHELMSVTVSLYPEMQKLLAGKLVSDAGIVAGLAGWAAVTVAALRSAHPRLLGTLGASWSMYFLAGGSIRHGDTPLVGSLKEGFHRTRPSELHHTFAFPSGHTTAATFICGVLLFVLLPAALSAAAQQQQDASSARDGSPRSTDSPAQQAAQWLFQQRWQLWIAAVVLTAAGRVAADVHWVSDTLAGACLGAALTAGTAQLASGVDSGKLLLGLLARQPQERNTRS